MFGILSPYTNHAKATKRKYNKLKIEINSSLQAPLL